MGIELEDKYMDKNPNNSTATSSGSLDDNKVQGPSTIEVKECTEDAPRNGTPGSHTSSDTKKKLPLKSRVGMSHTVPKPFSLSASSTSRKLGVDNNSSGDATSHNSSSGSQPKSPLPPARETSDHRKHHDEEDSFSVTSSSAMSTRTIKPKITVGVAPTFRSTARLERRREFYQKLEEKQKALEAEKRENEKRLKEEQEVVTKQLRKNMAYKANPVPNFYYEAPPPKLPLKKYPLTRPKSPNLNRRKSCSDTVNSSYQEVKGKHCVRHRYSVDGCKEVAKASNGLRTPNMKKSAKETPESEALHGKKKSGHDENGIDVVE